MKKILISLMSLLVFTSCVLHVYRFSSVNYSNNRISISAELVNSENENSPVEYIRISDIRSNVNTPHKVKILSSTIKIIDKNKEYIVKTNPNSGYIYIYKQGVVIADDFKAYI